MNSTITPQSGNQLWGIYHTDREYAHSPGDPLRTTVEAPTKIAAEEAAAKLGFPNPWAHPIAPEVVKLTEQILKRRTSPRQELARKPARGIRI
jgi:hypothetical protein